MEEEWEDLILNSFLKKFYEEEPASSIQIKSFNNFIEFRLAKIIEQESVITSKVDDLTSFRVFFSNVVYEKPFLIDSRQIRYINPTECKLRDITYNLHVID